MAGSTMVCRSIRLLGRLLLLERKEGKSSVAVQRLKSASRDDELEDGD
jgi:hypothetical protein